MNKLIVKFKNAYNFEGKEYDQVDLSGLENLKAKDLMEADQIFITKGDVAAVNEMNLKYNSLIAANVTKLPIEFFEELPAKEAIKVKNVVAGFLLEEE